MTKIYASVLILPYKKLGKFLLSNNPNDPNMIFYEKKMVCDTYTPY